MLETLIYPMVHKLSDFALEQWNNDESFENARLSVRTGSGESLLLMKKFWNV
jgi:hypothetical protein